MTRWIIILLLLAHGLMLGTVRCRTVWHSTPSADEAKFAHHHRGHDHDHAEIHDVVTGGADEHHPDVPDHSHVLQPDAARSAARVQAVVPELAVPASYVELSPLWVHLDLADGVRCRLDERRLPDEPPPLAGRTSHLLF